MNIAKTNIKDFSVRLATKEDSKTIFHYLQQLAIHEKELEQVTSTVEVIEEYIFEKQFAQVLIGDYKGQPVGFALFNRSFSSYHCRPGISLIDLFVEDEMRGKGFGKAILSCLADIAVQEGCPRLEWWVHEWNEETINHYRNWGANMVPEIRVYRMDGETLPTFAKQYKK